MDEVTRIHASVSRQDTHPIIALTLVAANEEIADLRQAIRDRDGLFVQTLLCFDRFVQVIVQVLQNKWVVEINYQAGVRGLQEGELLHHLTGD